MSHAGGDAHQARVPVPEDVAPNDPRAGGIGAHIGQHQEELVPGGHIPDIGLTLVEVEGLDRQGLDDAVIDLAHLEARHAGQGTALEAAELGHRSAVVVEALESHELDALDRGAGSVVLDAARRRGRGIEVDPGLLARIT